MRRKCWVGKKLGSDNQYLLIQIKLSDVIRNK
jgi:hypothetical protein